MVQRRLGHQRNEGAFQFADVGVDVVSNIFYHFVGHLHSVVGQFLAQDTHAGLDIRRQQLCSQTPFQARRETGLEALQFARGFVAGDDNLFACLVQGVEDVEEGLLCTAGFVAPELDVVHYQHINHLVEMNKVGSGAIASGIHILLHELFGGDIQHRHFRMQLLGLQSNGIGKMGLAQSHAAVKHQGVEGGLAGLFSHGIACRAGQSVAFALDIVEERVRRTELRVDAHFLNARNDKGVGKLPAVFVVEVHRHITGLVDSGRPSG